MKEREVRRLEREADVALLRADYEFAHELGITEDSVSVRFSDGSSVNITGKALDRLMEVTLDLQLASPGKTIAKALGLLKFFVLEHPRQDGWRYYIEGKKKFGIFPPSTRKEFVL